MIDVIYQNFGKLCTAGFVVVVVAVLFLGNRRCNSSLVHTQLLIDTTILLSCAILVRYTKASPRE